MGVSSTSEGIYEFDDFRVETARRRLVSGSDEMALSSRAFDLLVFLIENRGRVVSKEELLCSVWPDQFVEESNLTVQVSAIRKALDETRGSNKYITTVSGKGYIFTADVSEVGEEISIRRRQIKKLVYSEEIDDDDLQPEPSIDTTIGSKRALAHRRSFVGRRNLAITVLAVSALLLCIVLVLAALLPGGREQFFFASEIRRLTTHGNVTDAALSPDGKYYIYAYGGDEGEALMLGHTDGNSAVVLRDTADVSYFGLTFSPDGNRVYFGIADAKGAGIYRMPPMSRTAEKVLDGVQAAFALSPDESRIAFVRPHETYSELIVTEISSKNERVIARREFDERFTTGGLSWSPDGRTIAVGGMSGEKGIQHEVFGIDTLDGTVRALTAHHWNFVYRVIWQKDGNGFFIVGADKKGWAWGQIWHVLHPSGDSKRITLDFSSYSPSSLSVSDDGQIVLAVQHQQKNAIKVASKDDLGNALQISKEDDGRYEGLYGLSWMPDGRLLYGAFVGESQTIWTMMPDGSDRRQITSEGYTESLPYATSDGRYIVFHSTRSGPFEIWRIDADGSDPKQLTTNGENYQPHVSPDGQWVVFRSWADRVGSLWKVSIDGGEPIRLTKDAAAWGWYSPDGTRIVCGVEKRIRIIDSESGATLSEFPKPNDTTVWNGLRWHPGGKFLNVLNSKGGIWRIESKTGAAELMPELRDRKIYTFAWSPDGSQLTYVDGSESDDVVVIRNAN